MIFARAHWTTVTHGSAKEFGAFPQYCYPFSKTAGFTVTGI